MEGGVGLDQGDPGAGGDGFFPAAFPQVRNGRLLEFPDGRRRQIQRDAAVADEGEVVAAQQDGAHGQEICLALPAPVLVRNEGKTLFERGSPEAATAVFRVNGLAYPAAKGLENAFGQIAQTVGPFFHFPADGFIVGFGVHVPLQPFPDGPADPVAVHMDDADPADGSVGPAHVVQLFGKGEGLVRRVGDVFGKKSVPTVLRCFTLFSQLPDLGREKGAEFFVNRRQTGDGAGGCDA